MVMRRLVWLVVVAAGVLSVSPTTARENAATQARDEPESTGAQVRTLQARWIDVAAHVDGAKGSVWRTDVVVFNRTSSEASVELLLHQEGGTRRLNETVPASSSKAFEDVVDLFGVAGKGPLEVRSDQPVTVHGRTYSASDSGTVGQFVDSYSTEDGLHAGESGWLVGLRQQKGIYRSNVCITNTGSDAAEVRISLFTAGGFELISFSRVIGPGEAFHELEPFWSIRGRNNIACGCVRLEVITGSGILASASVIDERTNDALRVPMKK